MYENPKKCKSINHFIALSKLLQFFNTYLKKKIEMTHN